MKTYKNIDEVIAEIDAALAEKQNANFVAEAFTQETVDLSDNTPETLLPDYFSIRELIQYRKWTRTEIYDLLGIPDTKVVVEDYHVAHLYAKARVLDAERNSEWRCVINRRTQIPLPEYRLNPETIFCSWHGWTEYRRYRRLKLCIQCYPVDGEYYYRVRDLFERGWFAKEIKIFLGEPHGYGRNAAGWKTKLYFRDAVHLIEATEGWQNRPSVVAQRLYLEGISLSKIARILTLTQSECYNYTKHTRKMIRCGQIQRGGKANAK